MDISAFIATWHGARGGRERSNFGPFIYGLCEALDLAGPHAAAVKGELGTYEFEGPVPGGSFRSLKAGGSIDLYKRGCFIMEAKQSYLPKGSHPDLFDPEASAPQSPSGATYDRLMRDALA